MEKATGHAVQFHRDDPDGLLGDYDSTDGPPCHFATNCTLMKTDSDPGVSILTDGKFPKGCEIIAGKARFRGNSAYENTVTDEVYSNVFATSGNEKVCMSEGGRRLWCPTPLLRYRYADCPDPAEYPLGQGDCTAYDVPNGENLCFCDQPCNLISFWNEVVQANGDYVPASGGLVFQLAACALDPGDPALNPVLDNGSTDQGHPLPAYVAYHSITVSKGAEAYLSTGVYTPCSLDVKNNAKVHFVTDPAHPVVTIVARQVTINGEFGWEEDFRWAHGNPPVFESNAIPPSDIRVLVLEEPEPGISPYLKFGGNAKAHGIFIAPRLDGEVQPAFERLRGIIAAKKVEGQPKHVYCGCRAPGASCDDDLDCCHGNCTVCDAVGCNAPKICGTPAG